MDSNRKETLSLINEVLKELKIEEIPEEKFNQICDFCDLRREVIGSHIDSYEWLTNLMFAKLNSNSKDDVIRELKKIGGYNEH